MDYEDISSPFITYSDLPNAEERFKLEDLISTGSQAKIYKASDKENNDKAVVLKIVSEIRDNHSWIEEEFRILQEVSGHKNFPEFYGLFIKRTGLINEHELWMAMEYIPGGSVAQLVRTMNSINSNKRLPENVIAYILRESVNAMKHLHSLNIVSRDLKGDNILMTAEGNIKFVDFGKSSHLGSAGRKSTAIGTPYWMAPEVIECDHKPNGEYDTRCDVWALGITAIELADSEPPLASIHPARAMIQIVRNPPSGFKRVSNWSSNFADLVSECLVKNPDHRPFMEEMVEHSFISVIAEEPTEIKMNLLKEVKECRSLEDIENLSTPSTQVGVKMGHLLHGPSSSPEKLIVDDLAELEIINDETLIETLQDRWNANQMYTWLADILLSINPFSDKIPYDDNTQKKYCSMSRSDNDPHIYAVVDKAHQDMMHSRDHQTIILSGESGSGKTFNYHKVIQQFSFIGMSNPGLISKIKKCSIILDAFGNAATTLNTDSTRHCRFFDLTFSKTGKLSGGIMSITMLEKMRITSTPEDEGNFHILYYFYDGVSQSSRLPSFGLKVGRKYKYLVPHPNDNEVSNGQNLKKVEEALDEIGFEGDQIKLIYSTLSAILLLGNIEFNGDTKATIADPDGLMEEICRLLDIDGEKFSWALCNFCKLGSDGEQLEPCARGLDEAEKVKDAFVKCLYSRLVDYIVNTINNNLSITRLVFGDPLAIGVLDMFGFEANEYNSLGNLIVNIANEQLQFFYNQSVFTWEMEDYAEEGIPVQNFNFPNNRNILELFLAKGCGLLSILEDETRSSEGSGENLARQMSKMTSKQIKKVSDTTFIITHYVGRVKYDVCDFIEKNRDYIATELIQTMRKSQNKNIRKWFALKVSKTGNVVSDAKEKMPKNLTFSKDNPRVSNTKSRITMSQTRHIQSCGLTFRYALIELLHRLTNSSPHFIRCIRSNMDNSSSVFDKDMVRHQLKYHAVSDSIRIRQQGFSYRVEYKEFLRRYQFLAFAFEENVDATKENVRLMLLRLKIEGWAIGENKVFLKYYNEEFLSRLYEKNVKKIVKIQSMMRTFMMIKRKKRGLLTKMVAEAKQNRIEEGDENSETKGVKNSAENEDNKETQNTDDSSENKKPILPQTNKEAAEKIKSRVKFGENTIEDEAARYVQHYFRKWKLGLILQVLQIYRASNKLQLVQFSQQVHLYAQEMQSKMQRHNLQLDLVHVKKQNAESHKHLLKSSKPPPIAKLPLDHMINTYFDTTYLCDPARCKKGRLMDDEWDAPFKGRSVAAIARAKNMGETYVPDVTPFPYSETKTRVTNYGKAIAPAVPIIISNTPAVHNTQPLKSNIFITNDNRESIKFPLKKTAAPMPKPHVDVKTWENRKHNGYSNPTLSNINKGPLVKAGQKAMLELQERVKNSPESSDQSAPFNFQGILRKTKLSRDSMKRDDNSQESVSRPNSGISLSTSADSAIIEQTEEAKM